ncbi:MAG TPA: pilus assembly protein TadG-related protein [Streptosporangiaceae bacterium]|nr:pilus assembly protein TadG-related protein [Streptosporangiaceae bacterium]
MLTRRRRCEWPRSGPGREHGPGNERGSITVYTVVFAVAVVFLLALIIDGGVAINAKERAYDIAGQAARAAADDLDLIALRAGHVQMAPGACGAANTLVATYARATAGGTDHVMSASDSCVPQAGATIAQVTVTITTRPLVPGVFGSFTETASQTATVKCGTNLGANCP